MILVNFALILLQMFVVQILLFLKKLLYSGHKGSTKQMIDRTLELFLSTTDILMIIRFLHKQNDNSVLCI